MPTEVYPSWFDRDVLFVECLTEETTLAQLLRIARHANLDHDLLEDIRLALKRKVALLQVREVDGLVTFSLVPKGRHILAKPVPSEPLTVRWR